MQLSHQCQWEVLDKLLGHPIESGRKTLNCDGPCWIVERMTVSVAIIIMRPDNRSTYCLREEQSARTQRESKKLDREERRVELDGSEQRCGGQLQTIIERSRNLLPRPR